MILNAILTLTGVTSELNNSVAGLSLTVPLIGGLPVDWLGSH